MRDTSKASVQHYWSLDNLLEKLIELQERSYFHHLDCQVFADQDDIGYTFLPHFSEILVKFIMHLEERGLISSYMTPEEAVLKVYQELGEDAE